MNYILLSVQIPQSLQHRPRQRLHSQQRHPQVLVPLDQRQQVIPQHVEHHAHVRPIRSFVRETIVQAHNIRRFVAVSRVSLLHLFQYFNLVPRRLGVTPAALLNFQRSQRLHRAVFARRAARARVLDEPTRGEVSPAQLFHDDVAVVVVSLADRHGMVAAALVPVGAFVLVGRRRRARVDVVDVARVARGRVARRSRHRARRTATREWESNQDANRRAANRRRDARRRADAPTRRRVSRRSRED